MLAKPRGMRLIVVSAPHEVDGEARLVSQMVDAGLGTFHLRKPDWPERRHAEFLRQCSPTARAHIVTHKYHGLARELGLKVLSRYYFSKTSAPLGETGL